MAERYQVYKCEKCGNIVEVLTGGPGPLQCCDEKMVYLEENTVDAAREKHVPVLEKLADGVKVKVGDVAHPMEEKHYIEWIEVQDGNTLYRTYLDPGQVPEAGFPVQGDNLKIRAYCNLHGLWKG